MKKFFWFGLFLFVAWHAPGHASADQRRLLEVGAKTSLAWTTFSDFGGSTTPEYRRGFALGGFGRIGVIKWLEVQPELMYITKGSVARAGDGTNNGTYLISYVELPILGRAQLPPLWKFDPYAVVGPIVGLMLGSRIEHDMDDIDRKDVTNNIDFGMALGVGAAVEVVPQWRVTVEARYELGFSNIYNGDPNIKKHRAILIGVGVGWGAARDVDGDGIADSADRCPLEPEDRDGFQDHDGCPDLDNDSDGIPDDLDKCLDEAEDRDGFQDEDGCPDPDNDGDGVLDDKDECPDMPFARTANGCSPVYATITVTEAKIELKRPILFAKNKAEIDERTKLVLDEIATALTEHYPDRRVRIEGHADGEGSTKDNERLSQERADAIRTYLIGKDVAEHRLVGKGYGESQPLYHEDTIEAEQKNRRVEFVFITE